MKPTTVSRHVATTILTAIGVGLFFVVSVRAVHQISDRQYTDGKQRVVSSSVPIPPPATKSTVIDTVQFAANLTPLPTSSPSRPDTVSATSPFTPLITQTAITQATAISSTEAKKISNSDTDSQPKQPKINKQSPADDERV